MFLKKTLLLLLIFFPFGAQAQAGPIIISEIAWMGSSESSYHEWIELKNLSQEEISLQDYTLEAADLSPSITLTATVTAGGFYLLERSSDGSAPGPADQIYTGALSNSGESLYLKDPQGRIIDQADFQGQWPAGDNASKRTMCLVNGEWVNSGQPGGSPGTENTGQTEDDADDVWEPQDEQNSGENQEETASDPEDSEAPALVEPGGAYDPGSVVINEILSDPEDGFKEWIELYNTSKKDQDLSSCRIEEGGGAVTILGSVIRARDYFLIEDPKGYLNNTGDEVVFACQEGIEDRLVYGDWDGRKNIEAPRDGYSLARKMDGYNTFNNAVDFRLTEKPSPGEANIIISGSEEGEAPLLPASLVKNLIIFELLPNPEGSDTDREYIRLKNIGKEDIRLKGWAISDQTDRYYHIEDKESVVEAGRTYTVMRRDSKIALNNDGDAVYLYPPESDKPSLVISYDDAKSGAVFRCPGSLAGDCYWLESAPIGQPAGQSAVSSGREGGKPLVDFSIPETHPLALPLRFDPSDSILKSASSARYFWDFGDGFTNRLVFPEHTYFKTGIYDISLEIFDNNATGTAKRTIAITDSGRLPSGPGAKTVKLTEILPNPEADDRSDEFIEIYNYGEEPVGLGSWSLDDVLEGGSRPFVFSDIWEIGPGEYIAVYSEDSGILLNNNMDSAVLADPEGNVIDQVEYEKAEFKKSYSRGANEKWFWTSELSPNSENVIKASGESLAQDGFYQTAITSSRPLVEDIRLVQKGDQALISGQVTVAPGVVSQQFFYIKNEQGGIQVYSYKKDFPELKQGHLIEVRGEISEAGGEKRIKTKARSDIKVLSSRELFALDASCAEIEEFACGQLVSISGEIVERKGSSLYIDDGAGEIRAYLKKSTGINPGVFAERDQLKLTGVISMMSGEKVVLPRSPDDVVKKNIQGETARVLGEMIEGSEWSLPPSNSRLVFYKYLLIVSVTAIFYLGFLLVKEKMEK